MIDNDYIDARKSEAKAQEDIKAAHVAKKARQDTAGTKVIKHPWDVSKGCFRNHFWSYSTKSWLPIPVEYELQYH